MFVEKVSVLFTEPDTLSTICTGCTNLNIESPNFDFSNLFNLYLYLFLYTRQFSQYDYTTFWTDLSSTPVGDRNLSLRHDVQSISQLPSQREPAAISLRVQLRQCDAYHLPPSTTETYEGSPRLIVGSSAKHSPLDQVVRGAAISQPVN